MAGLRRRCFYVRKTAHRGYLQGSDFLIRSSLQDPPLGHGRLHHHQFGDVLRRE